MLRLGAVILNGLLEGLEGIHRLLEHLHHRDAPHVLCTGLAHHVLGSLVFRHQAGVFAAHHGTQRANGHHRCQQAGCAHPPIEPEHQHQHSDKHGDGAHDVSQVVGQQGFRFGSRTVQTIAQKAGSVDVKEAQRRFHQMCHALLADVGSRTEGRQMGTHQGTEIDHNARQRKGEGHPTIPGNPRRLRPIGSHGDQIPGYQPDADVRKHPQHHGHSRQAQPQEGEPLIASGKAEQLTEITLFLLFQ